MAKKGNIPRTVDQARKRRSSVARYADAVSHPARVHADGIELSRVGAKAGDIAWIGPCEPTGTRVVCYFDQNMDPSDCRNVRC